MPRGGRKAKRVKVKMAVEMIGSSDIAVAEKKRTGG
jgi:hypothetical protein